MRKLLKANFRRLWKDKAFLISMILMVIYGGALPIIHYFDNIQNGCVGIPVLGVGETKLTAIFLNMGLSVGLGVAFSAIFILIAMLWQNKAYAVAGCILVTFFLLFMGIHIVSSLNEPEYYSAYSYTENGITVQEDESKNPNYLSGTKRKVYEFLNDFTPGGQLFQIGNMKVEKPLRLGLYDGIIIIAATGCGMFIFSRKDLK